VFLLLLFAPEVDSEPGPKTGVEPGVKPGSGFLGREIESFRSGLSQFCHVRIGICNPRSVVSVREDTTE
jgi:hypothetical protein